MAEIGDELHNGPHERRWTCPECYADHGRRVTACDECGTALRCTIESVPVAVCTIIGPDEDGGA